MDLLRFLTLIIFSLMILSCTEKKDSTPTALLPISFPSLPSTKTSCSFNQTISYSINKDPSVDFIMQNAAYIATVTSSDCQSPQSGAVESGSVKFVTRNNKTITVGRESTFPGFTYQLVDLTTSGSTIAPETFIACSNGIRETETVTGGDVNSTTNTVNLTISTYLEYASCSTLIPAEVYEHTELKGMWNQACSGNESKFVNFYRNSAIYTSQYYGGSACSGGLKMYIEENGPSTIRSTEAGGKQLDISFQNFLVYLYTSAVATDFNSVAMCGKTNWVSGTDIDVSGLTCDFAALGFGSSRTFPTSRQFFDLFNKSETILYLGDPATGDGSTSANRPTTVLNSAPYIFNSSAIAIPTWVY